MFEITNNNTKINAADKAIKYDMRQAIDNGRLLESTGECFYASPNATSAQDHFLNSGIIHKLILSRITPGHV